MAKESERKARVVQRGEPVVQVLFLLPVSLSDRLRAHANARGVSMVSLVRDLLEKKFPRMPDDVPEEELIDEIVGESVSPQVSDGDLESAFDLKPPVLPEEPVPPEQQA